MQLPNTLRDLLVNELDKYLEAFGSDPDAETVASYVIEVIEGWADEQGFDEIISDLEESGALDDGFAETLENEMASNDEFEFTGEEISSLLERMCEIEWEDPETEEADDLSEEMDDF